MANNPYVNKVIYGNSTLIDLTSDTVTQADVAQGKYFHLPTGERVQGVYIRPLTIPVTFVNHRSVSTVIRYTPKFTDDMPVDSSGYITTNVAKMISGNSQEDTLFFKNAFVSIESTEANGDFELRSNNTVIAPKYQYKYWNGIRYYYYKCYSFSSTILPNTGGTIDIYESSDPIPEAVMTTTLSATTNDTYTAPAGTAYTAVNVAVPLPPDGNLLTYG